MTMSADEFNRKQFEASGRPAEIQYDPENPSKGLEAIGTVEARAAADHENDPDQQENSFIGKQGKMVTTDPAPAVTVNTQAEAKHSQPDENA